MIVGTSKLKIYNIISNKLSTVKRGDLVLKVEVCITPKNIL